MMIRMVEIWFLSWVAIYFNFAHSGSYFEKAKVPKFSMEGDDREQFLLHWQSQAIANLMAAKATRLQKYLNLKQQETFETCCQNSSDFYTYADCFKPVWRKGKLLKRMAKRRRKHRRSANFEDDMMVAQRQIETVRLIQQQQQWQQQQQVQMQQQLHVQQQMQLQQQQQIELQQHLRLQQQLDLQQQMQPQQQFQLGQEQHLQIQQQQQQILQGQQQQLQIQQQQQQQFLQGQQPQLPTQYQQSLTAERSPIGGVADWLTTFVQTIKEPPMIVDGKFRRPTKEKKQENKLKSKFENPMEGTLVGEFVENIFRPIDGLSDLLKKEIPTDSKHKKKFDFKKVINQYIQQTDNPLELQQRLPSWQHDYVQDSYNMFQEMTNVSDDKTSSYILSPRLFPLTPQEPGERFLSPDILSLNDNPDALGSVPQLLNGLSPGDKDAWMKFIMEASGVSDIAKPFGGYEELLKVNPEEKQLQQDQQLPFDLHEMYGERFDQYQDTFKGLYSMIRPDQIDRMTDTGYAFLSNDQLDVIYGNDTVFGNATFNTTLYKNLANDNEREDALLDYFIWLTDRASKIGRSKRAVILSPILFTPVVLEAPLPLILMPIILSPILFSPVILSPIILGPIILSPLLFSPIVLSPTLLSPVILSPALFDPIVLSPLILDPFILSPDIGTPLVLSPTLLSPFILTPLVLGGVYLSPLLGDVVVLSPLLLFPIVLSPIVLNPFILSPFALTPIILSPIVLSPAILDPHVLSPIILSPILLTPLILSPGVLSPLIKSPIYGVPVIPALRFLSPEVLSPNIDSPKKYYSSIASPSILSRRKRKNIYEDQFSSAQLRFPDSFLIT